MVLFTKNLRKFYLIFDFIKGRFVNSISVDIQSSISKVFCILLVGLSYLFKSLDSNFNFKIVLLKLIQIIKQKRFCS